MTGRAGSPCIAVELRREDCSDRSLEITKAEGLNQTAPRPDFYCFDAGKFKAREEERELRFLSMELSSELECRRPGWLEDDGVEGGQPSSWQLERRERFVAQTDTKLLGDVQLVC
jgi:hypothetical protein